MTKQMKAAMAAMLMVGTLPMQAQEPLSTTTKTVKVAPGETKTTVITKESDAGATGTAKHKARRRKAAHHEAVESETAREIRELKEKQAAQQAQIDALTQANAQATAALAAAQTAATGAEAQAQAATQQAQGVNATVQANTDAVQALKANVTDLQTTNAGLASTISQNKVELTEKIESPSVIHYKGVKITPVLFIAGEGVFRQRALNSDINTPLNSIPYPGASEAHTTELNFTARQTRLGGLFESALGDTKFSGYFESDFLGAGTTSNSNQSNSYLFRVRQAWAKAESKSGTAITAGQTWSLVTEDGKSTDVRTEKLPNTIDPQYMVGYSWARQPGFRIQQKFGNPFLGSAVTVAISAENAQIQGYTSAATPGNFFFASSGNTGGLYNSTGNTSGNAAAVQNYSINQAPDVVAKIALDFPNAHVELGGLARFFRERLYPGAADALDPAAVVPGAAPYNNTVVGGGGFASVRVTPAKFVDLALAGMVGDGTARYGSEQLGDVTVHPNGTLEPIRNAHGLLSIETHPSPKFDLYAYYGGSYEQRTVYATGVTATPFTGYAPISLSDTGCNTETPPASQNGGLLTPAACSGLTRYLQEGMIGFTYKAINSPKYGQLQYRATYSYLERSAWTGVTSGTFGVAGATFGSPKATENMVHVSMRYYIP
jgi:multidrug efflux pump subunit AcrA (membrane-fusion protein)